MQQSLDLLPDYIDPELWAEYVQQRKRDRKEMSPRSRRDRIMRLVALHEAGHDANACLAEALNGHWLDFYVPKDKSIAPVAKTAVEATKRMLDERERTAAPAPASVLAQLKAARAAITRH